MKNIPERAIPNACTAEAEQLIGKIQEAFEWIKIHRAEKHPTEPVLRRLIVLADHGPDYAPLIAFGGDDPPSLDYVAEMLAVAWDYTMAQSPRPTNH